MYNIHVKQALKILIGVIREKHRRRIQIRRTAAFETVLWADLWELCDEIEKRIKDNG